MINIAILGFGTVGSGVYAVLQKNAGLIARRAGQEIRVKRVLVLEVTENPELFTSSIDDILNDPEITMVAEAIGGVKAAYPYVKALLASGRSVVTSNKELVATHGAELLALAKEKGVAFLFEASVGGGMPLITPMCQSLLANQVEEVYGIVNGTTNYMLTRMSRENMDFAAALREAQQLGYAETKDPSDDVDGPDACRKIAMRHPDANIVVTPSDALVTDVRVFTSTIREALDFTSGSCSIVTVGIVPDRPETGYGYICASSRVDGNICKVQAFKEKPDRRTAEGYLSEGNYFWNAGIFVWNVRTIEDQLRRYAPSIMAVIDSMSPKFYTDEEEDTLREHFCECEKISIDYAVMEKSEVIYVIPGKFVWSDLGSWSSVRSHTVRDDDGNAVVGDGAVLSGCRNCIIHTDSPLVAEGLDGYVVAQKDGRTLVCRLSEEQHVRELSGKLNK